MAKSDYWENGVVGILFNATALANVMDNAASSPLTNLYVALHTADPGEAGSQTTSEATYTSYARVAVLRNGTGWTVSANAVSNAAAVTFPTATGGTNTLTYFSIGTASSGAGNLLYSAALTASLAVSNGVTPEFAIGDLDVTES